MCVFNMALVIGLFFWILDNKMKNRKDGERGLKIPDRIQSGDARSYMICVLVHWSTQIPLTCLCECMYCIGVCIYWGVT